MNNYIRKCGFHKVSATQIVVPANLQRKMAASSERREIVIVGMYEL